jgi:hypothetical protein
LTYIGSDDIEAILDLIPPPQGRSRSLSDTTSNTSRDQTPSNHDYSSEYTRESTSSSDSQDMDTVLFYGHTVNFTTGPHPVYPPLPIECPKRKRISSHSQTKTRKRTSASSKPNRVASGGPYRTNFLTPSTHGTSESSMSLTVNPERLIELQSNRENAGVPRFPTQEDREYLSPLLFSDDFS